MPVTDLEATPHAEAEKFYSLVDIFCVGFRPGKIEECDYTAHDFIAWLLSGRLFTGRDFDIAVIWYSLVSRYSGSKGGGG